MSEPDARFPILRLADVQLEAYNHADLDAFSACYSDDVLVLDERGRTLVQGIRDFRDRYAALFRDFTEVRAWVVGHVALGSHVVDHEKWSRVRRADGSRLEGEVLVRYTERDGKIVVVEFLR